MKDPGHFRFSVWGFSAKRMAWLLSCLGVALLPLHAISDYRGDEYLTLVSLAFTLASLFLGSRVTKSDPSRSYPFAMGLITTIAHSFLCKL